MLRRWQAEQHDRDDHREEARGVDAERPRVAADADDEPGERGADDPAEVPLRGRQRDRADEVLRGHEVGQHRLVGGEADRLRAARARTR